MPHKNTPVTYRPAQLITWQGETLTIREWSDRTGISGCAIHRRIKNGWPVEKMLTTPKRTYKAR